MLRSTNTGLISGVLDCVGVGTFLLDVEDAHTFRFVTVNPRQAEILGRDRGCLLGRTPAEVFPREQARRIEQALARCASRAEPCRVREPLCVDPADRGVRCEVHLVPVCNPGGETVRILGTTIEVAATDTADDARRASERRELAEREKRVQVLEVLGATSAGLAHDLNNMLMAISSNAELICALGESLEVSEATSQVLEATERAADLTRQLVGLSRPTTFAPRDVDLHACVLHALRLATRADGGAVEIGIDLQATRPEIFADPVRLEQALATLLIRAGRELPSTRGLLVQTRDLPGGEIAVDVRASRAPGDEENGAPTATRRIDDPSLHPTARLIEEAGGALEVSADAAGRPRLLVRLPAPQKADRSDEALAPRSNAGAGRVVLVVEEDDLVRTSIRHMLERNGYRVIEARSGLEALRALRDHAAPIEAMLADAAISGITWEELAALAHREQPGLRTIRMSADITLDATDPWRPAEPAGPAALIKPFAARQLLEELRQAMETRT